MDSKALAKRTLLLCLALLAAGTHRVHQAIAQTPAPLPTPLPPSRSEQLLAPGLALTTIQTTTTTGEALRIQAVKANLKEGWRLKLEPAEYSALKRTTTSTIAARKSASVAINGGYFAWQGAALGAVKVDGEWLRLPWKNRTAIGFGPNGATVIDNLQGGAVAEVGGIRMPVAALNGFPVADAVSILTPRFASSYMLRANEAALEIENGKVAARVTTGKAGIRADGWTLVAHGTATPLLQALAVGQPARFGVETSPNTWSQYPTILGAGPRLLRAGKVETTEVAEEFRPDVIRRGPRTAIGIDKAGNMLLVVVDGRQTHSRGLTLPELAQWMLDFGAVEAINLDGGGSTTLVINNQVMNSPSDGTERAVANAVLLTRETVPQPPNSQP